MDFRLLLDQERKGLHRLHVVSFAPINSFYDLLASEARLQFVAIAKATSTKTLVRRAALPP